MTRLRRALVCALMALGLLAASAGPALAHANLLGSTPALNGRGVSEDAAAVTLRFSEGVQVLNKSDISVVNGRGQRVDLGSPHLLKGDARQIVVPVHHPLVPDSYTVRYRVVSADSHSAASAYVFAVGKARLGAPIQDGTAGLKDTSPTAVAARAAELIALMLLVGLIGFRLLVWSPAVATAAGRGLPAAERDDALRHGQRLFWRSFWALAVLAGVAETAVLAAKSAVVFHTSLVGALRDPASAFHLVGVSRFGDFLGWRGGALFALVAVAFFAWNAESASDRPTGRRDLLGLMGLFGVIALALLAGQGHASQAPLAPLSVATDAVHLGGAAVWIGGLPCLVAILLRAPRLLPEGGRALASTALSRFSKVALWSIVVISVTGLARLAGELSSPVQLFSTGYGRDLLLKASLLLPILVLARRNRRLVAALANGLTPTTARLRAVARTVQTELAIAMGIVAVAALLVAQIPGRA